MMGSSEDLNPQIVGLDKALENLGNRNMTTAELAKMFGTENVVAAQHLVSHRDQVTQFTKALTGTDGAYKMAAINNDTLKFEQKQTDAAFANTGVKLGQILLPALNGLYDLLLSRGIPAIESTIQVFAALVKGIMAVPAFVSENKEAFIALGVALISLNAANIAAATSSLAHAAAEKGRLIWTESATVAQWAMNAAMTANPIGLVVAAIALLVGGFITLYKNSETLRGIINGVWEVLKLGGTIAVEVADLIWKGFQQLIDKIPGLRTVILAVGEAFTGTSNVIGTALDWIGDKVTAVTNFFSGLYNTVVQIGQSIGTAMKPGLEFIANGFLVCKNGVNDFITMVQNGVTRVTSFLKSITPSGFTDAVKVFSDAGSRISKVFNDTFSSEQTKGHAQQKAADKKHLDDKTAVQKKTAETIVLDDTTLHAKGLSTKSAANTKQIADELAKAKAAAEKEAADKLAANTAAAKAIEKMNIDAITDELARKKVQLAFELNEKLAVNTKSKLISTRITHSPSTS